LLALAIRQKATYSPIKPQLSLRELRPHATTTAALVNPENIPQVETQVSDIESAARNVEQEITILNASVIHDIDAAFARLVQMRADALLGRGRCVLFQSRPATCGAGGSPCDSHAVLST